ncbi:UNVERIFIED_CONTAM: UDP-glycosyltransferase 83A1 [Sesamum calycinum]|uniref:UDP-glycosyltransferase 83A1 n=1 Tax=Sesamum calycinum TaxID=2727403 RepID=A0AAW2LYH3_9LAMI
MAVINGKRPHVLAVPYPAQGHVKPLMKLSRQIARHGIKVTFVNIECIHEKIVAAAKMSGSEEEGDQEDGNIVLTSVPDGRGPDDDQNDTFKLLESLRNTMPGFLTSLIENINRSNSDERVSCVIADVTIGWLLETAQQMGAEPVLFSPPSASALAIILHIPRLLEEGNLDSIGLLPVGPLLETNNLKSLSNSCNFHPEDASCLSWLHDKPPGSVVYVSFGSLAVLSQQQLDELALGLELSGRAFLWVVRSDLANGSRAVYPDGFLERVGKLGKIVEWAPQEMVLSHRSIACFLSHCGWNSTLEGLSNGVPFLSWPYFADQHHNQNYICDKWEVGVRIDPEENGIRTRHEIKTKIEMVFSDDRFKENAMKMKEICWKSVGEGGSSYKNFKTFVDHLSK